MLSRRTRAARSRSNAIAEPLEARRLLAQSVASFTLINTTNNQPIAAFDPISNGSTINLGTIGTSSISVRANTSPSPVGSVKFALDGNSNFRIENMAPYALAGDMSGVYVKWNASFGTHTVTATPFTSSAAGGTAGTPLTISFTVLSSTLPDVTVTATSSTANEATGAKGTFTIMRNGSTSNALIINYALSGTATNGADYTTLGTSVTIPAGSASAVLNVAPVNDGVAEGTETVILTLSSNAAYNLGAPSNATVNIIDGTVASQAVSSFTLINADSGLAISQFNPLPNAATINLASIGTSHLSIVANTTPGTVGSVQFSFDGNASFNTDNSGPYSLLGDSGGVYTAWNATVGSHTLTATPFTGSGASGTAGTPLTITFTVVNSTVSTWSTGKSLPVALGEVAAGVINGKIYVVGEGNSQTVAYNIATNTWTGGLAARPFFGNHHAAEVINNKLYLFGGLSNGSDGKVQIYDPTSNTWTTGASMPFAAGSCASALIGGLVYVAGGIIGSSTTNLAAKYDPVANTWTSIASMHVGRNHCASATDGTKLYVFGGRSGGNTVANGFNEVQIYDPGTNTWVSSSDSGSTLAPLPQARGGMGKAVYYNGEFYVMGGETSNGPGATSNNVYNRVDIYNPTTNTWRLGTPMPSARHGIFPVLSGTSIYVAGGGVHSGNSQSTVLEIDSLA